MLVILALLRQVFQNQEVVPWIISDDHIIGRLLWFTLLIIDTNHKLKIVVD